MAAARRMTVLSLLLLGALALGGASSCGGAGPDSPDARSFEYQTEGWCYRWVPKGEADLDKARKYCLKQVAERRKYLRDTLGKEGEKGPTAWNLEACLKILGWERCPE